MGLPGGAACWEVRKAVKIVGHTVPSMQPCSLWTRSGTGTKGMKSAPSGGPSGSARSHRQGTASPGFRCCCKHGFHSFSKKASCAYCVLGTDSAGLWTDDKHRCGPRPTRNLLYSTSTQRSQQETCRPVIWVMY
ncbi:hypothetical protein HJG60_008933 [Phyllostomus discolor]|uniref:Uncharacterized protein n=1 Tax=Phyllostomus discolor TaxID=89673 RepID=A0A833YSV1_9CHIR|nr:hypothetical protein HJG60_008933 [Phyllostomus discolor]